MKREFTPVFEKHGSWISAYIVEIPGVNSQGRTRSEARANLEEALRLILEIRLRLSNDGSLHGTDDRKTVDTGKGQV